MCRGFQPDDRDRLRIKAFHTTLKSSSDGDVVLPDFLTLHFLPRINGALLQLDGSTVRPDSPAFATLHRVRNGGGGGCVYGTRERMVVCEGTAFRICAGDVRMLKGIFRKGEGNWRMDCKCSVTDEDAAAVAGVNRAEVSVAAEGAAAATESVPISASKRRRRCCVLEEIPEEREGGEVRSDGCCCCCSDCDGEESDGETAAASVGDTWDVDVGFWAVCLGVGLIVSGLGISSVKLRRKYFL
ncbi:hypothetical protein M569_15729 [Genlisea aurea]|uniref:Uncharacterized protein n=1 Tax=Genlisea aurea TaxID=192259 RepID=S8C3U3_9LAMI|nr:hypothetical protein M569_15729 [Genlisea aurea]